ncbi:putative two-component system sensor histidine kinase [Sphingobium sp. SYK-6]|uniref:sensor histidine kinase n=1 Tax=Sphingobium sp. (strain NBRC 103272 / SYK-6) TaxID=627192 RepID=UPI0002277080|nr:histidine kinase dimerization/phospho-acceptor domain-containing protein [Sphingobium sp. SYK-6]BAK66345.1 putative two-component system sensor histidine kinase [Sphingobium sp. SYK-6]
MRFNDILRTVLANPGEGATATVTRWRQCIDLIAQHDVSGAQPPRLLDEDDRRLVLGIIARLSPQVPLEKRIASIVELGGRLRSPGLVRSLAQDHPSLVAALMSHVRLADADWAALIPDLGPLARSVLRRRTDLGPRADATLRQFGPNDMALPSLVDADILTLADADRMPAFAGDSGHGLDDRQDEGADDGPSQFERIVARIERFKESRVPSEAEGADQTQDIAPAVEETAPAYRDEAAVPAPTPIDQFTFETDASGLIRLVGAAPRGAAFGLSIAVADLDNRHGADGTALGAFRRRAAFDNARFSIGEGALAGEWRMSATPRFDKASGRFLGYAGSARRELPHEGLVRSTAQDDAQGWAGLSAQSTRQLIHELRTPLNAIQGYAEMIQTQLVGPVPGEYRDMAQHILSDAHVLLTTFDDLDLASRIARGDDRTRPEPLDIEALLRAIMSSAAPEGVVALSVEEGLPAITGDRQQVERMLRHLVRAGCAALEPGEQLTLRLQQDGAGAKVRFLMARPNALQSLSERDLLDHGGAGEQKFHDVPPLGLAFTLRLVRGIAAHLGGGFSITSEHFCILMPVAASLESGQESQR